MAFAGFTAHSKSRANVDKKGIIFGLSAAVSPRRELAVGFRELSLYTCQGCGREHCINLGIWTLSKNHQQLQAARENLFRFLVLSEHSELLFLLIIRKLFVFNHMNNWLIACLYFSFILQKFGSLLWKWFLSYFKEYSEIYPFHSTCSCAEKYYDLILSQLSQSFYMRAAGLFFIRKEC